MKVLVVGADGFVGRHVVAALADHTTYAASRNAGDIAIDLLDVTSIRRALIQTKPDVIIATAGIVGNMPDVQNNLIFAQHLLESVISVKLRPKRVVITGSAAEYGVVAPSDLPVTEQTPSRAHDGYGLSKTKETAYALQFGKSHDVPVVIARLFNPVGPGMQMRFLLPKLIAQMAEVKHGTRNTIEVNRLDSRRDYVDIRDVALAYRMLAEGHPSHAIYNVGSGISTSNSEILELIIKHSTLVARPVIRELASDPEPLLACQADIERLQTDFGWKPRYSLEQTIKDAINAARKQD